MNHSIMVVGFLCLAFVLSLSLSLSLDFLSLPPSLTLIRLTWAGGRWKQLTRLQPINNQLTLKRLDVAALQCQIVLFQSVPAPELQLVFFFSFFLHFSCVFFFQGLPDRASYLHLQPFCANFSLPFC